MDYAHHSLKYFLKYFHESEVTESRSPEFTEQLNDTVKSYMCVKERRKAVTVDVRCKIRGDFPDDEEQGGYYQEYILDITDYVLNN